MRLHFRLRSWGAGYSPDRLDALVWAVTELAVTHKPPPPMFSVWGSPSPSRRQTKFPDGVITDGSLKGGYAKRIL